MIAFDLRCSSAHQFEGWFASSAAYELQQEKGLIACPVCNDKHISKAPSAPFIGRKTNQISGAKQFEAGVPDAPDVPVVPALPATLPVTNAEPTAQAVQGLIQKLAAIQTEVLKESTWVGRDFAEEARAIHYGETDNRKIHGEASPDEAQALSDEGIAVAALPLPFVPPAAKN